MELWEQTLQLVEGKLDSLFKTFQSEVASGRRNTLSTPQHQILLRCALAGLLDDVSTC